jgi:rubredoxin
MTWIRKGRPPTPNTTRKCPACGEIKPLFKARAGHGNSYSRYADKYICSECGTKEAFEGFFWRERCPKRYIKPHHREEARA